MASLQAIVTQDLSRGTNLVTNPYVIGKQQSILLNNLLLDEHGSLRTRDGTLILTTSPDAAPNVRPIVKLFNFVRQDGITFPLALVQGIQNNNELYDRSTTPWASLGVLGTQYAIPDLLTFTNKALIVNGYEPPRSFDGTTLAVLTGTGGGNVVPAGAAHHALHQGYYWVWNTAAASSTSDGPSSLRSSDLNNVNSWPAANQIFVDKDDGDSGMGMGQFTIAESGISPTTSQILFKQFKAFQMTGVFGSTTPAFAIQKVKSDMGCIAPRTIRFAPGFGLLRLTHRGFALFDGVQDTMISEEIRPLIFGNSVFEEVDWGRVTTAVAAVVPNPPLYVAFVPVCGGTGLSRVFVYDLVRKAWTVFQYPQAVGTAEVITNPSILNLDPGSGSLWILGGNDVPPVRGAAAIFLDNVTVARFYWAETAAPPGNGRGDLRYKRSLDAGITFPEDHATGVIATLGVNLQARVVTDPVAGTPIVYVIDNNSILGSSVPVSSLYVSRNLHDHLDDSTWARTDFGSSAWQAVSFDVGPTGQQVCVVVRDVANPHRTLLLTSNDYGVTFPNVTTLGSGDDLQFFDSPQAMQMVASIGLNGWVVFISKFFPSVSGHIYRSTDNGVTWTLITDLAPGTSTAGVGAILAATPTRLVAAHSGKVYTSSDAGQTWNPRQDLSSLLGDIAYFGVLKSGFLGAVSYHVLLDGAGPGRLMWRSTDYGQTWGAVANTAGIVTSPSSVPAITGFAVSPNGGHAVITTSGQGEATGDASRYWYTVPSPPFVCPPAPVQVLIGDYNQGAVRQIFSGDGTDDGAQIVWRAALKPVSSPSPQANGYFRRMVIKVADVVAGQTVSAYVIVGPTVTTNPRTVAKTLTCPVAVGLGFSGYGIGPWGTSPFGGVTENSEMDLTMDLGLIGTNARPILQGGGKITIRGIEYHVRQKPLRRASVFA